MKPIRIKSSDVKNEIDIMPKKNVELINELTVLQNDLMTDDYLPQQLKKSE